MLAALGLMGFTNIHRMNGLKNWGGFCMNLVAALTFAVSGIVRWPVALGMARRLDRGRVHRRTSGAARAAGLGARRGGRGRECSSGIWLLLRL